MATTGLGVGGPAKAYGVFAAKAAASASTPATKLTGLGVGGPARTYALFAAKAAAGAPPVVATRITRLGVGGPMMPYNDGAAFGDKAAAVGGAVIWNYPIYRRKRRS